MRSLRRAHLPLPLSSWQLRQTDAAVIAEIDRLLDEHTEAEIVTILNARGSRPGVAERFTPRMVWSLRRDHGFEDRFTRLRRRGLLTLGELAEQLDVAPHTVKVAARRPAAIGGVQRQGCAPLRTARRGCAYQEQAQVRQPADQRSRHRCCQ